MDFREHQLDLLKNLKNSDSRITELNIYSDSAKEFFDMSITYQLLLIASFIFRFSNIELFNPKVFMKI